MCEKVDQAIVVLPDQLLGTFDADERPATKTPHGTVRRPKFSVVETYFVLPIVEFQFCSK